MPPVCDIIQNLLFSYLIKCNVLKVCQIVANDGYVKRILLIFAIIPQKI